MWYHSRYFQFASKTLVTLLIILLFLKLLPYFNPFIVFFENIIGTLLMGLILYYVFRPVVHWLVKLNVPFAAAAILVFLFLGAILAIMVTFLLPLIIAPIQQVANSPAAKMEEVKEATIDLMQVFNLNLYSYQEVRDILTNFLARAQQYLLQNTFNIVSTITRIAVVFVITPFCLFYFLRDDEKFHQYFLEMVPPTYRPNMRNLLSHLDQTLSIFISGQMIVALSVTVLAFIGLFSLQIDHLAFLIFITFLLALIPYLGSFLAIIPPLITGFTMSYVMGFFAGLIMVLVHLIEANLITPYVMMKRFDVHPLTIILLVIASFSVFGIIGPLLATPVYVVFREIFYQLHSAYFPENERISSDS